MINVWVQYDLTGHFTKLGSHSIARRVTVIIGNTEKDQKAVFLGSHYGRTSRYLVGHVAKMHGKWPTATCYF